MLASRLLSVALCFQRIIEEATLTNDTNRQSDKPDDEGGVIASAISVISGSNLPAPIKRNFFKALGQLCTAAIEIPVAYMEGVVLEKHAETHARIKLIEKSANEIAAQMQFDPEYARAAVKKFGQRVIREQINLDRITSQAADTLTSNQPDTPQDASEQKEVDDDWLNVFEKEAAQKSTEEMQAMFARLLAGEIRRPSTFSIRSVRLLGSLDQPTAKLFKMFCSMCIAMRIKTTQEDHIIDARVPSLGGNAALNALSKYGLSFDRLNLLQEYGLIISDYNSWIDYRPCIANDKKTVALPFEFGQDWWALVPKEGFTHANELQVNGVALTSAGKELMTIVASEYAPSFATDLVAWFDGKNLSMTRAIVRPET